VLAAQARYLCSGYVGVVDVASQQAAECLRVLARAAAAALMGKKADAVDVREDSLALCHCRHLGCDVAVALALNQFAHMLAITAIGAAVAQLFFKSFTHILYIPVFAEDQRQDDPIVARAHLAIGAVV